MMSARLFPAAVVGLLCMLVAPAASAQTAGGIAGTVTDSSGAVMPGVTVEAESPALIEKIRTAVTDAEGRYNIIALQPGTYSVTFSLSGFNTTKREGIVLTAGFTAPVNAELRVGSLEETVTVTGDSPLVDTSNVTQQTRISQETLETLPSGSMGGSVLLAMTPGMTGTAAIADLGGTAGYREGMGSNAQNEFRGRIGMKYNVDGLSILSVLNEGTFSFVPNPLLLGEMTIETGGSAESSGNGLSINALPREGSNRFSYMLTGLFSNGAMQSDNLTEEWIARGIRSPGKVDFHKDGGGTVGGPIVRDRAWFFAATRYQHTNRFETDNFYNATQDTLLYTPDLNRPAHTDDLQRSQAGRVTWQASRRNKINFLLDYQNNWVNRQATPTQSPEAKFRWNFKPSYITQVSWTMPLTNRLLFEAAAGAAISHWDAFLQPEVTPTSVRVVEQSTGRTYGANTARDPDLDERYNQRASMSYVTGTHSYKVGITVEQLRADYGLGFVPGGAPSIQDLQYTFLNQRPVSITQFTRPYVTKSRVNPDLTIFAQDQWVMNRVSINYGLRYDSMSGYVPAQEVAATRFVPARSFARVEGLPDWKDISPRVGMAWDVFGTSRTAVKFSFGKYISKEGTGIADGLNPINTSVNNVTRTWGDTNNNFIPDCDLTNFALNGECGPISNPNFGKSAINTVWSDDVLKGWGNRRASWDIAMDVQQQLGSAVSVSAGYNYNWHTNFRVTDNLEVTPNDYDPFCITAPTNPGLPGGGGYQVCGLYDVKPAFFGRTNNVVVPASTFGEQQRVANFIHAEVDTRLRSGMLLRGGIDSGTLTTDQCFVVDSPQGNPAGETAANRQGLLNCRSEAPWLGRTQIKLQASYPFPGDFVVAAILQNIQSVPYGANLTMTNAQVAPALGRNLAACGTRTIETCTATVVVPLINPDENYEKRRTQIDLRLTKRFPFGSRTRLQANLDLYNLTNSAALLTTNSTYGSQWRNPTAILNGRLLQLSARLTF
jgi:hypothetical protein